MPCAACKHCKLQQDTPCSPNFTSHKCSNCAGYLHGLCGVVSPMGISEVQRMCETCVPNSDSGTESVPHKARGSAKRNRWTFEQQVEAIDMIRNQRMKAADVGKHFGVKLRTVQRALEKANEIKKILASKPYLGTYKANRDPQHPEMENTVLEMVVQAKSLELPINRAIIHTFALKACVELREKAPTKEVREKYSNFRASTHWVTKFLSRHNVVSRDLHESPSSIDQAAIAARMQEIRTACESYDASCIFNVEETALYFRNLPKRTYLAPGRNRKTVCGITDMKVNDRLMVYICSNVDGTARMPICLIGTAAKPRCFRIRKPPIPYYHQKNAWCDLRIFKQWFNDFLEFVRISTSKPVLLLMGNQRNHEGMSDPREQVTIMQYPPHCTSVHQPMNQGIILAWKTRYKTKLLAVRVASMDSAQELRDEARTRGMKVGTMGLAQGHLAHVLDAAELGRDAWEEVSQTTIARCWIKANTLPATMQADLIQAWGKTTGGRNTTEVVEDLDELCVALTRLSMAARTKVLDEDLCEVLNDLSIQPGDTPSQSAIKAIEAWISMEDNEEFLTALQLDMQDELLEVRGEGEKNDEPEGGVKDDAKNGANDERDGKGDGVGEQEIPSCLPSYRAVADHMSALEAYAAQHPLPEFAYHLRQANLALLSSSAASDRSERQADIRDFMRA